MPSKNLVKIFRIYSCGEEDRKLKDRLDTHLKHPNELNAVVHWDGQGNKPEQEWDIESEKRLNEVDIILLLISADFMISEYWYSHMEVALDRHRKKYTRVIPIILRYVDIERTPFGQLKILPENHKPIYSWPDKDEACFEVNREVNRAVDEVFRRYDARQIRENADEHFSQGGYEKALEDYNKALHLLEDTTFSKDKVDVLRGKAKTLYRLNRVGDALHLYEEAIRLEPNNSRLYRDKGDVLFEQKRFAEALSAYESAAQKEPNDYRLLMKQGDALSRLGELDTAIEAYDSAINSISTVEKQLRAAQMGIAEVYASKGRALLRMGRLESALLEFNAATERNSDNAELWRSKGEICSRLGDIGKAREAYEKAIALEPNNAYFHKEYGDTLLEFDCFLEALQEYNEAISLKPDFDKAYKGRSQVFKTMAQKMKEGYDHFIELAEQNNWERDDQENDESI